MYVRWITGSGLVFENDSITIMVDPYLTNSIGQRNPKKNRRIPVDESIFDIKPDVLLITHEHEDHLNLPTLDRLLTADRPCTILAGYNAFLKLDAFRDVHNVVMQRPGTVWSTRGITFYAVRAEHSDTCAVGFIIDDGKKTYYISGDTLYNFDVIDDVIDLCEDGVDYAFLPINGVGNNMNARDASDFAAEIGAKCSVPIHYGLFDDISPDSFDADEALILEPYKRVKLR